MKEIIVPDAAEQPKCDDFVVFLVKKPNNARVLRLYQCRWCLKNSCQNQGNADNIHGKGGLLT